MTDWTKEDIEALERILLRVRADALSQRNGAMRLQAAYGDRRGAFGAQVEDADSIYKDSERLLFLVRELDVGGNI